MTRLMTLDASRSCVTVSCRCGWSAVEVTKAAARSAADAHRRRDHRRQAQYVASKRRRRAGNGAPA